MTMNLADQANAADQTDLHRRVNQAAFNLAVTALTSSTAPAPPVTVAQRNLLIQALFHDKSFAQATFVNFIASQNVGNLDGITDTVITGAMTLAVFDLAAGVLFPT